jgi:DNA-binding XRE family transcriptional regulator
VEVRTNLTQLRARRGLGAAQLAAAAGVSRQTVYAIEAGTYIPNTALSLKLACALDATVEEIFQIEPEDAAPVEIVEVALLGDTASMTTGQLLRLCSRGGSLQWL